jgi:hypothetical protein
MERALCVGVGGWVSQRTQHHAPRTPHCTNTRACTLAAAAASAHRQRSCCGAVCVADNTHATRPTRQGVQPAQTDTVARAAHAYACVRACCMCVCVHARAAGRTAVWAHARAACPARFCGAQHPARLRAHAHTHARHNPWCSHRNGGHTMHSAHKANATHARTHTTQTPTPRRAPTTHAARTRNPRRFAGVTAQPLTRRCRRAGRPAARLRPPPAS